MPRHKIRTNESGHPSHSCSAGLCSAILAVNTKGGRTLSEPQGIAGTLAAVNYLAEIGEQYGKSHEGRIPDFSGRRLHLKTGMTVLHEVDHVLSVAILDELETLPGERIHGIMERNRLEERVETDCYEPSSASSSFTVAHRSRARPRSWACVRASGAS
jgi:hypothetical protein